MAVQTNANNLNKKGSISKFFRGVRAELRKVIWPSRKELVSFTSVVVVACLLMAIGTWITDMIFGEALKIIIK